MSTRISERFALLRGKKEKGFIAYITAGDPSLDATADIVLRLEDAGVDLVELGIPFSDPLADGRVNQESAMRALAAGATLPRVVETIARVRTSSQLPLMCYSYLNPIQAPGFETTVARLSRAGLDGLLLLDLPPEEAEGEFETLHRHGLDNICLITPTSPDERIRAIVAAGSGFIYVVSRAGVTGMQNSLSREAGALVRRVRRHTRLPIALGFGISSSETAAAAAAVADAVVVGSAIVDRFHRAPHTPAGRKSAARWVGELVKAVKGI